MRATGDKGSWCGKSIVEGNKARHESKKEGESERRHFGAELNLLRCFEHFAVEVCDATLLPREVFHALSTIF